MATASRKQHSRKSSEQHHKKTESGTHSERDVAARNVTPEEAKFIKAHEQALSKTMQRAKWVHSSAEHEDRPGQSLATRSHEVIRRWAEERGAKPATTASVPESERPRVLRFDFPGFGGEGLREIRWDDWFSVFDERQLVFLFQEHKADGSPNNFFQLDSPEREEG
jgi:hypothetical protein